MEELTWNSNLSRYEARYDDTHTLCVDGDAFASAEREEALERFAEKFPEMEEQELEAYANEHYDDECWRQAYKELTAPDIWTNYAAEFDKNDNRIDGEASSYVAWIQENV